MRGVISAIAAFSAVALLIAVTPAGRVHASTDDEFVPENVVLTQFSLLLEDQDRAFDQSGRSGPFKNFVIRDPTLRSEIEGEITRSVTRYDLRVTYGISNTWNLSLNVPFVEVEQTSTLTAVGGASAEAQEFADRLRTQTIQGIGDVELASLHRPLFSDWNAFSWGYGLTFPGTGQKSPYVGSTSLQLGEPVMHVFGFLHYTRYPAAPRSRFDVRAFFQWALGGNVTVGENETARLGSVQSLSVKTDWTQEIGFFMYGFGVEFMGQGEHTLGGERLIDQVRSQTYRARIGFGNISEIEESPLAIPYQLQLEFRSVQRGANVPNGDYLNLSLLTYF